MGRIVLGQQQIREGGNFRRGAEGNQDAVRSAGLSNVLVRAAPVPLTPILIEAFVVKYLLPRFDEPAVIPSFHRQLWADYCSPALMVADAAPRGFAKSTAITHSALLADHMFRNTDYSIIVSNTWAQGVEFLASLTSELEENELLRADFGVRKFVKNSEDNLIVQLSDGWKFRIMVKGVEQKIRGFKWGHRRPRRFILDDVEDDEQVENKERREKLSNWVMKALLPAGSDDARTRMAGTVMHFDSFLNNALRPESGWLSHRFMAHRDYDDFSNLLWPERFSEARLRGIRQVYIAAGNPDGYSQEYLNTPMSEQDAFYRREDLVPLPDDVRALILKGDIRLRKVIGWDLAISKEERRDFTAWSCVGVDQYGKKYWLDGNHGRWDSKEIIEELFRVELLHRPEFHALEKGQIEKALGPFLYAEMAKRQVYLMLHTLPMTKDKRVRGRSWQAATRAKHVFYDTSHHQFPILRDEMVRFPKGEHDDYVDSQTILGLCLEDMPNAPTDIEARDEDEDEHMDFVRRKLAGSAPAGFGGRSPVTGY